MHCDELIDEINPVGEGNFKYIISFNSEVSIEIVLWIIYSVFAGTLYYSIVVSA